MIYSEIKKKFFEWLSLKERTDANGITYISTNNKKVNENSENKTSSHNFIEKTIIHNDEIYKIYKNCGWANYLQLEQCLYISGINNSKAIIVGTISSFAQTVPLEAQYDSKNRDYFETNYLNFHVTANEKLFDDVLEIVKPLCAEDGLFFISLDENGDIMKNIGYIQLC